jgi:hypothetical protein
MLDTIRKRIAWRNAPVRRFAALHTRAVAGIAAAFAFVIGSAALAIARRVRRNGEPRVALLSVDGPNGLNNEPTRDELYEMARQRDIPGRSTMTKAELVEALNGR